MTAELRTFVDIDASPERVWDVLTDVPAMPEWNPFVVRAEGTFAVGQRLTLHLPRLASVFRVTLRPTVLEATPNRRVRFRMHLAWPGIPGLFDSEQTVTIEPKDGGVRLWEEARFSGLLVPLMTRSLNRRRSQGFSDMNARLKARIEGGSAGPG